AQALQLDLRARHQLKVTVCVKTQDAPDALVPRLVTFRFHKFVLEPTDASVPPAVHDPTAVVEVNQHHSFQAKFPLAEAKVACPFSCPGVPDPCQLGNPESITS